MREIKFRAYDKKFKIWYIWGVCVDKFAYFTSPPHSDLIHCQYTGLKDKNGKEIYEGDIVIAEDRHMDFPPIKGWVKFGDGWYYIVSNKESRAFTEIWIGNGFGEVIGNIYENSELLQESP